MITTVQLEYLNKCNRFVALIMKLKYINITVADKYFVN